MRLGSRSLIVPVVLVCFALTAVEVPSATWPTTASLSLGAGVSALSLMALAAVLGARWKGVESLFGGLDRVYETHKWLGVWALVFASFHLVFKAGTSEWQTAAILSLPGPATRLVRQLSFVALMLIVLLALNRKIPYRTWRWWHKLSGPLFLIVVAHWLSFKSPIALVSPAGVWLATLSLLGVAAAAYKLLLYPALSQHAEYRLQSVSASASAVHLRLVPVGRRIPFLPGQFAFLSFEQNGLREPHPFTIASAGQDDGSIAFVVRSLGDYTARLVKEAKPGLVADVYAPFGRFKRVVGERAEIWIAGGVGVTPFISWLQDASAGGLDRVTFFHFFTPGRELPETVDLSTMAQAQGVELIDVPTGPGTAEFRQRFTQLVEQTGASRVQINFCGPRGLLDQVRQLMRETGVAEDRLRQELFEFR
ncbi:oxidoreductase [Lysobacter maris]|uniref:Oxidoreductase n=1 Tax=Marilutibacter maris TaxID=1605891 RepID=A0A508AZV5_9GAMM|nr:ferredoxin reductase family protein [Lysobacter maris]KAB8198392.1 oxidoreductase [Lysobacter maris]